MEVQEGHRVRTLIPFLDYGELTKTKVLPAQKLFTAKTVQSLGGVTPCPKLAKALGASEYGLFVEKIIETLLDNDCDIQSLNHVGKQLPCELQPYFTVEAWTPLAELILKEFVLKNIIVEAQVEIGHNQIVGHPDLVSCNTVYDIKTTGRFGKMRIETIFQLLSYYCLAQLNNMSVTHIGLVLPLQLSVVTYNLEGWNWKPFYEKLQGTIDKKIGKADKIASSPVNQLNFVMLYKSYVGHHTHKDKVIENINTESTPLQFFVGGNMTTKITYTQKFKNDLSKAIINKNARVYIHSPYVLNLSHPGRRSGKREEEDEAIAKELGEECSWGGWTFKCLRDLLIFGDEVGTKGVVVHCGKRCGSPVEEANENMRDSVIACSQWASEKCPLIIETSAAQGGEILYDPQELAIFYLTLPEFAKKVVTVCVDTCHVFAAGYDPMEFVKILYEKKVPISLFHLNDSKCDKGCKKDRHACPGKGYIGIDSLLKVVEFAVDNKIDVVTE